MEPDNLANQVELAILAGSDAYASSIISVQGELYSQIITILKDLELDNDGYIKQNATNRRILKDAQNEFNLVISQSIYQGALEKYLSVIGNLDTLNNNYFTSILASFSPNKNFLSSLQSQLIEEINTYILSDGLQANVALPLNEILSTNINSGGSFSGMLSQLRTFIEGESDELQGRLLSYSRTFVTDALFNYSRAYQQAVTSDLGLEFYIYSGGLTDTSRKFCQERAGQFFHHNEVEDWARLSWPGERSGTTQSSIFIFAGGWNCRHSIIPVDTSIVPQDVINRNVKNGNYNP